MGIDVNKLSKTLMPAPKSSWPTSCPDPARVAVFVSSKFLVQVFEGPVAIRLSVNRVKRKASGKWRDEITWDELMQIKRDIGMGDRFAVEIYPEDEHIVNVANMRHLWVLPEALPFGWRNKK